MLQISLTTMLRSFLLLSLVIFSTVTNVKAEAPEVKVTYNQANTYLNDIGKSSSAALSDHFIKLFGKSPNVTSKGKEYLKGEIIKELRKMIYGTITLLGLSQIEKSFVDLSVKKAFIEVVEGTAIVTVSTKGIGSFTKGMAFGFVMDLAKVVIQDVVYKTTGSRVTSGAAVALVEQSVIYGMSGGSAHKILVQEAELVFSRAWDITSLLLEVDEIQNATARNEFDSALKALQVKYTKKFCQSSDSSPSNSLINSINSEVDAIETQYSSETNVSDISSNFKNKIYERLVQHKAVYRFTLLDRTSKVDNEDVFFKYLNDYFSPKERWIYRVRYDSQYSFYTDVDTSTDLHRAISRLARHHDLRYVTNENTLKPNDKVGSIEFVDWLDEILTVIGKIDNKTYDNSAFSTAVPGGYYLTNITFPQVANAFYKEIYGENYAKCLAGEELVAWNRAALNREAPKLVLKAKYPDNTEYQSVRRALFDYYSASGVNLRNSRKLKYAASAYLNGKKRRKDVIMFGYDILFFHKGNKQKIDKCNATQGQG